MTLSTTAAQTIVGGNGVTTAFDFSFAVPSASDIQVIYTDPDGNATTLSSTQYAVALTPPGTDQIWGNGGTITYPLSGSPIANGTTLTISRVVPLTQTTSISNQGDFAPEVIEEALDMLCMEIQQVAARTGQFRGTWITSEDYNFGDVVIDGVNGSNTGNYYMCAIANTSSVWTTDLANGDWILAIQAAIAPATLPLSIANGGTGSATATGARTNLGLGAAAVEGLGGNVVNRAGNLSVDVTANSLFGNNTGSDGAGIPLAVSQVLSFLGITGSLLNVQLFSSSGTYTPTSGTTKAFVRGKAGGGSGSAGSGPLNVGGGGGGGFYLLANNPTAQTITIGAGGASVSGADVAGNAGGTTSFGSIASATGGIGGGISSNATTLGGTGSGGTENFTGGSGWALVATITSISVGGAPPFDGVSAINVGISTGTNANSYGGGGTGSASSNASGTGRAGFMEIWEFGL